MSAMTRLQMNVALRGILAEPSEDRYPDDDDATLGIGLNTWLNIGTKRYFADTRWATSVWTFTVTGSDTYSNTNRIYSLVSDCLEIDKDDVSFDNVPIKETTRKELWAEDQFSGIDEDSDDSDKWPKGVGTPKHFYFEKEDVIGLYPTPDADANGKTVRYSGVESPDDYSADGTECPLPYDLCMAPVHWAAWQVFTNDSDPRATEQLNFYQQFVALGKDRKRTRQREKPIGIAQSQHYWVDANEIH